jgi:multisubunit Na+/H+ antiporter MnhG subunit
MIERTLLFNNQAMLPFAGAMLVLLGIAIVWLYRVERHMVRRTSGIVLTVLRVVLLLLLLLMLTEPIISVTTTRARRGAVIVMMDHSRSMQIPDRERPAHEKFRIADALGLLPEGVHRSTLAAAELTLARLASEAGQAKDIG